MLWTATAPSCDRVKNNGDESESLTFNAKLMVASDFPFRLPTSVLAQSAITSAAT